MTLVKYVSLIDIAEKNIKANNKITLNSSKD
jgi:hypothetical protein